LNTSREEASLGLAEIEEIKRQGQLKTNSPLPTTIFNDIAIKNIPVYKKKGSIIHERLVMPANDKANENRVDLTNFWWYPQV